MNLIVDQDGILQLVEMRMTVLKYPGEMMKANTRKAEKNCEVASLATSSKCVKKNV